MRIDGQLASTESTVADQYDLAESLMILLPGYFHPGMSELKQRQLAAIISVYNPQEPTIITPGTASTSTMDLIC